MDELDIRMAETLMALDGKKPDWKGLTEFGKAKWEARVEAVKNVANSGVESA